MDIKNRIQELRKRMALNKIDFYLIPTDDYHESEFVGDYFKEREYISGFTGSAGTLVISENEAGLWTDGRYFLQAEQELKGTEIKLFKMGEQGVPTIFMYLLQNMADEMTLGFDGRCLSTAFVLEYQRGFERYSKKVNICCHVDLVNDIWNDRPEMSHQNAYVLEEKYSGESYKTKIEKILNIMKKRRADLYVLSSLDDIAWLLNIRGNDVEFNPVVLSYLIINNDKVILYCNEKAFDPIKEYISVNNIELRPYNQIYKDLEKISFDSDKKGVRVLADLDKINYLLYQKIAEKGYTIIDVINPTTRLKAIKNETEIQNEQNAHIKDGVAFVKFLNWFYKTVGKEKLYELDVAEYLYNMRKEQQGFIEESFESIVAYGKNGAVIHYSPTKESNTKIQQESFMLMDTGGHYYEGTTDITRTIACGKLTNEQKKYYTLVLKGNLALGDAKFKYGVSGSNLDILARKPLWNEGLDYNHGTGHGVGYLLNVHEGPNNIRWKPGRGKNRSCVLEEGMITSNEPGIYLENKYGIRLENMIVCKKSEENSFGAFMKFDTLTLVPFDLNAIEKSLLDEHEIDLLNNYHQVVREKLFPHLSHEEQDFLEKITRKL